MVCSNTIHVKRQACGQNSATQADRYVCCKLNGAVVDRIHRHKLNNSVSYFSYTYFN